MERKEACLRFLPSGISVVGGAAVSEGEEEEEKEEEKEEDSLAGDSVESSDEEGATVPFDIEPSKLGVASSSTPVLPPGASLSEAAPRTGLSASVALMPSDAAPLMPSKDSSSRRHSASKSTNSSSSADGRASDAAADAADAEEE